MGSHANAPSAPSPNPDATPPSHPPQPSYPRPLCHSCALFRHSCAGRNPGDHQRLRSPPVSRHAHHPANTHPFPNSSLPPTRGEVRRGVGSHKPTHQTRPAPIPTPHLHRPRPNRHTRAPLSLLRPPPSFLRRQEPRDPQPTPKSTPHTHPSSHPPTPTPSPIHPSPPTRGEVRWGVRSHEPTPQAHPAPIPTPHLHRPRPLRHPCTSSAAPAPFRHSCPLRHSCAPFVIPAQAGTEGKSANPNPQQFPNP